jgi:hypothetical protein
MLLLNCAAAAGVLWPENEAAVIPLYILLSAVVKCRSTGVLPESGGAEGRSFFRDFALQ